MGGGVSTVVKNPEQYHGSLSEEDNKTCLAATKHWRIYSEDLEWAAQRLPTNKTELSIGRHHENSIVLSNRTVSSRHAILKFNKETNQWSIYDKGSSTGSLYSSTHETIPLAHNVEQSLGLTCSVRLGKSLVTFVSDRVICDAILVGRKGPCEGKSWHIPRSSALLTAGASDKCDIDLSELDSLAQVEFQIFRYNNWFAITDVSSRSAKKTNETEDKPNLNGIYLNGRQIKRREMHFLWMGCKIGVGVQSLDGESVSVPVSFTFKCRFKNI